MKKIFFTILGILLSLYVFAQKDAYRTNDRAFELMSNTISYPFSYIVLGDTRQASGTSQLSPEFIEILHEIEVYKNDETLNPEFAISMGDIGMYGYPSEYQRYCDTLMNWMSRTNIPYITVPGNHEFYYAPTLPDTIGGYELFLSEIGDYDKYFDILDWRFVYINNVQHLSMMNNNVYSITTPQLNWLSNLVLSNTYNCPENVVSFTHVQFYRFWDGDYTMNNTGYQAYYDTLSAHGCRAFFAGHFHDYKRQYNCADGLINITSGGGGAELWHNTFNPPIYHNYWHFLYVTVYEDGSMKTEMYLKDGGHNDIAQQYDFWLPKQADNGITVIGEDKNGETKNYVAKNSIIVAGSKTYTAKAGSNVKMVAGKNGYIELLPGFEAEEGSEWEAYVQDLQCTTLTKEQKAKIEKSAGTKLNEKALNNPITFTRRNIQKCIYPNPSTGVFTVNFSGKQAKYKYIKVFTSEKKLIKLFKNPNTENNFFTIDLSSQANGVYYIVFYTSEGSSQDYEKVIIQK